MASCFQEKPALGGSVVDSGMGPLLPTTPAFPQLPGQRVSTGCPGVSPALCPWALPERSRAPPQTASTPHLVSLRWGQRDWVLTLLPGGLRPCVPTSAGQGQGLLLVQ